MSVSTNLTSQQIGAVSSAFDQFNTATTGSPHPGLWVVGDMSTVQYCSMNGGAAKRITSFPIELSFDHYYCQTPDGNKTALESTESLFQNQSIPYALVRAATSSAGEHKTAAISWISMGFATTAILAWTVAYF